MDPPVVLVTGTSSGIGRASVRHLQAAGAVVVATARDVGDIKDLADDRTDSLPLDVTKEDSMLEAVEVTLQSRGPIDVLVNNAGYGAYMPVEETPVADMRRMFEVNLFGLTRLTQLVLPGMRAQGSGRIVNVSSAAGHVALPMMGAYAASKFALRALSTSLRMEVAPFGLHVSLVEPGRILTRFGDRAKAESHAPPQQSPYAALHENWHARAINDGGAEPEVIARAITHAATARRPRLHYRAPSDAKAGVLGSRILPGRVLDAAVRRYLGM